MKSASDKFKPILDSMEKEELLNFIWNYDQYVKGTDRIRNGEGDCDICSLNIEEYYHDCYKKYVLQSPPSAR